MAAREALWFRQQLREVEEHARVGQRDAAVELLRDLADHCHEAWRENISQWHEIQALWLLGVLLEDAGEYREAAEPYARILQLRREALAEAAQGIAASAAAVAICELRAGHRRRGKKFAAEALRLHGTYPMSRAEKRKLEQAVQSSKAKGSTTSRVKPRRRPTTA
ncbi:MAG: hypothetical protein IT457_25060 [Planctomycetes bacterium]|nr:hypothetical protein [Planctomycetota bacterium]